MTAVVGRGDRFAGSALDARRGRGLTVAEVADAACVPEAVVRAAERGDAVPDDAARGLCLALGIEPRLHVPGTGVVRPAALDARHARTMAFFEDVASRARGMLALPDVAALQAREGMTDAEAEALRRGAGR